MSSPGARARGILGCAVALSVLACLAVAAEAHAQNPAPTVVLLEMAPGFPEQAWPEAERRVAAELAAAGITVLSVPAEHAYEEGQGESLDEVARHHSAGGAMIVVRRQELGDVRVWIRDRSTDETIVHTVASQDLDGPDAAAVVALRVTEVVFASQMEFRSVPIVPSPVATRASPAPIPTHSPPAHLRLSLGAGVMGGPEPAFAVGALLLGAAVSFDAPVALGVEIAATPVMTIVGDGTGNRASVGVGLARAHLFYEPLRDPPIGLSIGIGGGVMLAWALGEAVAPNTAADQLTTVPVVSGAVP